MNKEKKDKNKNRSIPSLHSMILLIISKYHKEVKK